MAASRVNKYEKRRKNTKSISILLVTGSVLFTVLLVLLIFGGGDEAGDADGNQTEESADGSQEDATDSNSAPDEQNGSAGDNSNGSTDGENATGDSEGSSSENDNSSEVDTEMAEPSDDNVIEAYTGNWQPVGTEQSEPHTINYNEGSQDRQEMRKAVAAATGLSEENLTMWWIERNGDQEVVNTVSSEDESEIYRVYLNWVAQEGWQPTKVERLEENDQKWRFE